MWWINKELKERVRLLEYENQDLKAKINQLIRVVGPKEFKPIPPVSIITKEGEEPLSKKELEKKYR